jgi:hypothetical protein
VVVSKFPRLLVGEVLLVLVLQLLLRELLAVGGWWCEWWCEWWYE